MGILYNVIHFFYKIIREYRWKVIQKLLNPKAKTLLDIGCQELFFYRRLKRKYKITLADYEPKLKMIKKEDVQALSFKDNSFDIVLCQEVLEHVPNPVKAMKELKRVAKKQLIITIPYEPFFTFWRGLYWEKEHFWAITPRVLRLHLDKPSFERTMFLKRYYVASWKFDKEKKASP